jgi:hypothetical protein
MAYQKLGVPFIKKQVQQQFGMVYSSYPISIYDFPCYSVLNPFNKAIEHGPFRDDLSIYPLN